MKHSTTVLHIVLLGASCLAADIPPPAYTITPHAIPEGIKLEASGLALMPDGRLAVASRRGEVWIIDHPQADPSKPEQAGFHRFASGMHEVLGLDWHDGALYAAQRSEVTRLRDTDGDDVADEYLTAAKGWGVSGNYHEYAYGPVFDPRGTMWIALNATMGAPVKMPGQRATEFPWRGWAMTMQPGGRLEPLCAGLRSPSGIGLNAEGDVFCTDQQGNWWGTNPLLHLSKGAFFGHGGSVEDTRRPESPVRDPGKLPQGITVVEAATRIPGFKLPSVWFPYVKMGQSPTGIVCDTTGGRFGPFEKQLFVGEFVLSGVNRVFLETVGGEYQGACFNFIDGLECGALRLAFLSDGSMMVGETNRGWNSRGSRSFGLERIRWSGRTPFEILKMEARPDGFEITFTEEVDASSAAAPGAFAMTSYTYIYHDKYGSDEIDSRSVRIDKVEPIPGGRAFHLHCSGLRLGFVHELRLRGIKSSAGAPVAHPEAYYTLNRLPK